MRITTILSLFFLSATALAADKPAPRQLKIEAEVGRINAKVMTLPNGETVDFPWVANALFYAATMNSNLYIPMQKPTELPRLNANTSIPAALKLSPVDAPQPLDEDQRLLAQYGFYADYVRQLPMAGDGHTLLTPRKSSLSMETTRRSRDEILTLPGCLENIPLYKLRGEVVSFDSSFGGGFCIGYGPGCPQGPTASFNASFGGSVSFKSTRLDMQFYLQDNFVEQDIAGAPGTGKQTSGSVAFGFSVGIPVGFNFFWTKGISDVITAAISSGLSSLQAQMLQYAHVKTWNEAWHSIVVHQKDLDDFDTTITLRAGGRAGIAKGDRFKINNVIYTWRDKVCESQLQYIVLPDPVALVEVFSVGPNLAFAKVLKYYLDDRIFPGALATVDTLIANP